MSQKMDRNSKNLLNFRPKIEYVEPPPEHEEPNPIVEPKVDNFQGPERLYNLANAVDVLGATLQARINERSKNIKIRLDPKVDAATIMAMKHLFGEEEFITYDQYRQCREKLCKYGSDLAKKTATSEEEVEMARAKLRAGLTAADLDGATDGGLRPELSKKAQVIEPIDIVEFQAELIKLLEREIWKTMIYKPFKKIPGIGSLIPKECPGVKLNKPFEDTMKKAAKDGVAVLGM